MYGKIEVELADVHPRKMLPRQFWKKDGYAGSVGYVPQMMFFNSRAGTVTQSALLQ
jgi:hypothetical protein